MSDNLQRLKERKLVQWALAYLAGAWLVLQVTDILGEQFSWPSALLRSITVLLGIGFLAALVLAWYHGEKGQQRVSGPELLMLSALLVLAGAAVTFIGRSGTSPSPSAEQRSIAVLPFANMSSDPEQEYFSDGLTEELLNALAQVPGLRVAARTSSFAFKDTNVPVDSVARVLRVAHVLEGSVRRSGNRLRITAQLINARDGYHLWSQTYERPLADIFQVQDEISRAIVSALRGRLAGGTTVAVAQATENVAAHDLYLRGLFHWNRRRPEDLKLAIRYFEQAIQADPNYARAHAGLALTYAVMPTTLPGSGSAEKGKAAARRALELDSTLAEGYAARGSFAEQAWDWAGAERDYTRAIEMNPSFATAHQWRAELYQIQRRLDESRRDIQRALRLDPLSLIINFIAGTDYLYRGEYDLAVAQLHRTLEIDPSFERALFTLMTAHVLKSEFDQAADAARRLAVVSGAPPERLETFARARQSPAHRAAAVRILEDPAARRAMGPFVLALNYALVDDRDAALAAAAQAVQAHHPLATKVLVDPLLRRYRSDPRYIRLRRQMGLE